MYKHVSIIKKELLRIKDKLTINEIEALTEYLHEVLKDDLDLRSTVTGLTVERNMLSIMEEYAQNEVVEIQKQRDHAIYILSGFLTVKGISKATGINQNIVRRLIKSIE